MKSITVCFDVYKEQEEKKGSYGFTTAKLVQSLPGTQGKVHMDGFRGVFLF